MAALGLAGCALLDAWSGAGWFLDGPWQVLGALAVGYLIGSWVPALPGALVVAGVAVGLTVANQRYEPGAYPVADDLVFFLLLAGAPAVAGATLTRRREQVAELRRLGERIEEQRGADLELARLEERQRIEVEVHRRLIERIGGIVLLAEGARQAPSPARADALAGIEETARSALEELRDAVGVLRTTPEPDQDSPPSAPQAPRPAPTPIGAPDLLLATGLGLALAVETVIRDFTRGPAWANAVAAFAVAAPLVWRRHRPLVALVGSGLLATATTAVLTPLPMTVSALGLLLVTAYAAGAHVRRRPVALVLAWGAVVLPTLATPAPDRDAEGLLPSLVLSTLAVLAGVVAAGAAGREAVQRAWVGELARAHQTERRAATATTRLELARGLHDSVAQAMTVTCLQTAAARDDGSDVDAALASVLDAARDCMAELRSGLDELDGHGPALDLAALRRLAEQAGLEVRWDVDPGGVRDLPDAALVHRVLREALTNAARHAPGCRVQVRVMDAGDRVELEVLDDGAGRPTAGFPHGTGTGLVGLREALGRRGGTLHAERRSEGGFRLRATLPARSEVPA